MRYSPGSTMFSACNAFVLSLGLSLGYEFMQESFTGATYFTIEETMINV